MATDIKRQIKSFLEGIHDSRVGGVRNPEKGNSGKLLFDIYTWQVVSDIAEEMLKAAYEQAQQRGGIMGDDDRLRLLGEGDHIVAESDKFSATAKVSKPRANFDREAFITDICKTFKLQESKVQACVKRSTKTGKASLTKRVLEA